VVAKKAPSCHSKPSKPSISRFLMEALSISLMAILLAMVCIVAFLPAVAIAYIESLQNPRLGLQSPSTKGDAMTKKKKKKKSAYC